ncbi:LTA synthase family protein [Halobacterium noricense]|uniref:LTA synthase family protein n=1 Tax=Halobacterium noricense TaxID=223182 RepID=UPI001E34F944|nr:LTA synthase family protein [Halobacterium noricense]UHH26536.1 LTA synthase family protein [Halobacterium noricense]
MPKDITEAARAAHADHPDKRLVIHYLQPHRPFITSDIGFNERFADNPWEALGNGEIDRETVWQLYRANLDAVFDEAYELGQELPGRAVMTSDHGNLLGERVWPFPVKLYGHPEGVRHPGLVEVPWAVLSSNQRPRITDEGVTSMTDSEEEGVRDHLRDLGYT